MKVEQLLAVQGKQHSKAAFSKSSYWTEIEKTPRPEQENVRKLPGEEVQQFSSEQIRFHEQIGEGGQGKIYNASLLMKAMDGAYVATNGKYAVKKFKGALHENHFGQWPEQLMGFHSQCHYVCKFYGYFNDENAFCLLMQKYDTSLRKFIDKQMEKGWWWCTRRPPFHGDATMAVITQIAIGMAYLHHLNILHRDLKADNIFVNVSEDDDENPGIVIGDFDIAPTVEGSGFWRAPEILQALKDKQHFFNVGVVADTSVCGNSVCGNASRGLPFTKKSDVYSFGMTCYEILTGGIPFEGAYLCDFDGVLSGKRPKLPSNLNPKMVDLLSRCWHHDPDARPTFMGIVMELKGLVEETEPLMSYFSLVYAFRQVTAADSESNLVELKQMVRGLGDKYTREEDFVGLGFELVEAIEQFNVEFGLRSFTEHPSLPFTKWLARLASLETTDFKRRMFLAACPQVIPEHFPIFNLIQVLVNDTMRRGSTAQNSDAIIREDQISAEDMAASWKAWREEMQRRPRSFEVDLLERQKVLGQDQIVSRHEVCNALLTGKLKIGRAISYQPCDFCKALPYYASKPLHLEACTFHLYTHNFLTLKLLFHIMRKLFLRWL